MERLWRRKTAGPRFGDHLGGLILKTSPRTRVTTEFNSVQGILHRDQSIHGVWDSTRLCPAYGIRRLISPLAILFSKLQENKHSPVLGHDGKGELWGVNFFCFPTGRQAGRQAYGIIHIITG